MTTKRTSTPTNPVWDAVKNRTIKAANFGDRQVELLLDSGEILKIGLQYEQYSEREYFTTEIVGPKQWAYETEDTPTNG